MSYKIMFFFFIGNFRQFGIFWRILEWIIRHK